MGAVVPTNGFMRMANTDVYTDPSPYKELQIRAISWVGATAAGEAAITDATGATVCMLSVPAAHTQATLDGHFWQDTRPWLTPITAIVPTGKLFIAI